MALDRTRSSLELLLNISRELATTLDLNKVLDRVLSLSIQNVDAERGSLIVLNENKQPTNAAIYFDNQTRPYTVDFLHDIVSDGLAGWVVNKRKPVLINDTSADKRWLQRSVDTTQMSGPKSAICVPVTVRDDLVGVLTMVHPKPGYFNEENLALLQAIADLAGIAIHNATLYESLNAAHQRYYELFEDSIYPILITDLNGKILEANRQASRSSGFIVKELIGKKIQDLHEVDPEKFSVSLNTLHQGKTVVYESNLKRSKQPPLPIEIFVQKISFEESESLQWLIRDISERKESDSLREDLAAMIYHDLRAPLSNIISSLDILDTMLPAESASSLRSIFQITYRSADRMQRSVNSLLDINRLETGQALTNKKTIDVLELAQEAKETVLPSIEGKQQQFKMNFSKKFPHYRWMWI
jgi:PAS domain S-box-containing protein